MKFPLPPDTLAAVIDAENERAVAKDTFTKTAAACNQRIADEYAKVTGVARLSIVSGTFRHGRLTRRTPGPLLVTKVEHYTGHHMRNIAPADIDDMDVTLTCRYVTEAGPWSMTDVFVDEWAPWEGDPNDLPARLPSDLTGH